MKNDEVNHPQHYVPEDPAYECVKVAEAWGLDKDAYLFNVLKYICRTGKKDPRKEIQDLEKAQFFLSRKIDNLVKAKEEKERKIQEQIDESTKVVMNLLASAFDISRGARPQHAS